MGQGEGLGASSIGSITCGMREGIIPAYPAAWELQSDFHPNWKRHGLAAAMSVSTLHRCASLCP